MRFIMILDIVNKSVTVGWGKMRSCREYKDDLNPYNTYGNTKEERLQKNE